MSAPTPPPEAAASPSAPLAQSPPLASTSQEPVDDVQVFRPADESLTPAEPDPSFYEPTISDVQSYQSMITGRSKQLNEAPFMTSKQRDAEKAAKEQKKADKWPTATIRIKFSDGTQIQSHFPSSSPIQPVYAFVRESLAPQAADKPFTFYQPPRTTYPEHPVPQPLSKKHINPAMKAHVITPASYGPLRGAAAAGLQGGSGGKESLSELGLVPQSVLLVKWDDADMNSSDYPAPLKDELRAKAAPLPPPAVKEPPPPKGKKLTGSAGEVKIPKWLQKGLMKKK